MLRNLAPLSLALASLLPAQHGEGQPFDPRLAPASTEGADAMKGFQLAPGLAVELVAAEPGLANPVAFTIDDKGRLFVVETFRLHQGVTDNRSHRYWLEEDLSNLTVADRVAMQTKHQAKHLEAYSKRHERVRVLTDTNNDRVFEASQVFADGWNGLEDGIIAGVLVDGDDVWVTNIPSLWRLRDTDGDGAADERSNLQDGYGVHVSLLGHDMHGLAIGPDRRLYFSIGDRGFNVKHEGLHHFYPHEGAVLRCELDGSRLEVVHRGLRNPQELAFDNHGNLFTGDNNSDAGDEARWVYIVEGGNSGWCIGYQSMEGNYRRGMWNAEKLWWPRFPGQAAWIVPPIVNVTSGPSGLSYYPGTGLSDRYQNNFFICDFRGNPRPSGIWNLEFTPSGAGFEMVRQEKFIWNVLPTDADFGTHSGLYLADWVTGWGQTGKGRVYRVYDPKMGSDRTVREVRRLLAQGMKGRTESQLQGYLGHPDRRIRQRAQFELVDRGEKGLEVLTGTARDAGAPLLQRLHAIWGTGILARSNPDMLQQITGVANDGVAEIRAQFAKIAGDANWAGGASILRRLCTDPNSRVRFFAAQGLGRLGDAKHADVLITMLRDNDGRDAYLRHAAAHALRCVAGPATLARWANDESTAVRMGVLLALRQHRSTAVTRFLGDKEPLLVVEAARAIYDFDAIPDAMPQLAALSDATADGSWLLGTRGLRGDRQPGEALHRRVLSAHRWLGQKENAEALLRYAARTDAPRKMREEALAILSEWRKPKGQDRVFGNWRPVPNRDANAADSLKDAFISLLGDSRGPIRVATARTIGALQLKGLEDVLANLVQNRAAGGDARNAALEALDAVDGTNLRETLDRIEASAPAALRKTGVRILGRLDPTAAMKMLGGIIDNAKMDERQNGIRTLAGIQTEPAHALVERLLTDLEANRLPAALHLEAYEAADKHKRHAGVRTRLERLRKGKDPQSLAYYLECLEGGNARKGQRVFRNHPQATCTKCHNGDAGPKLDGVGQRLDRRKLLESLIHPTASIAEGYGSIIFRLKGGEVIQGLVQSENGGVLEVKDVDGKVHKIPSARIESRSEPTSSMPPMVGVLNKSQLRDLIQFLSQQK